MNVPPSGNLPRRAGKLWGPGPPGRRLPVRLSYTRELPHRIVFLGGALAFVILYMAFLHMTPGKPSARAEDTAAETTARVPAGIVDSSTAPRPFQGLLDTAKDGAALDSLDTAKATDPYRTLMWNLKRYSVAEVGSLAETVASQDLAASPDLWRGRFVRATGVLVKSLEIQRLGQNEAGYENRWRGFLVDDDANAFAFDVFEKPEKDFDRTDVVTIEGVFLQVVTYEAHSGLKKVPFIEAKTVKIFQGERTSSFANTPTTLLLVAALVIACVPLAAYMISSFLARKHEADLVAALEKARQRRGATLHEKAWKDASPTAAPVAPAPETLAPPPEPPKPDASPPPSV